MIQQTPMTPREEAYLKYFTDGNVSLDYLKKIIVRDRILKTEKGMMLELFPSFLTMSEDFTEDVFDSNYYSLPAQEIRKTLTTIIGLIENEIFAQDVATLNTLASKFEKAIGINEAAKVKLLEEEAKLNLIISDFEKNLTEAKKVFTAYDVMLQGYATRTDPVEDYIKEHKAKIEAELAKESAIQAELVRQQEIKRIADENAKLLSAQILESQKANQLALEKSLQEAELAQAKSDMDAIIKEQALLTNDSVVKKEVTSKSNLPILLGAGLLAVIFLGGNNE